MYNLKPSDYFSLVRHDIINLLPRKSDILLDIGCGTGATAHYIKDNGYCSLAYGVEYVESAAQVASAMLDGVSCGDILTVDMPIAPSTANVILCLDVLEHLADPWSALLRLKDYLHPDGVLIASIPNIAYFPILLRIIFDRFEYQESGVLDKTHLRFFTLHTIKKMFDECDYEIIRIEKNRVAGWKMVLATILTLGVVHIWNVAQYKVVAHKRNK
jgi:2-polyprenyl-3-methyl-5-hydroxy-6-metoxy-1,4-benzoquinol methylase